MLCEFVPWSILSMVEIWALSEGLDDLQPLSIGCVDVPAAKRSKLALSVVPFPCSILGRKFKLSKEKAKATQLRKPQSISWHGELLLCMNGPQLSDPEALHPKNGKGAWMMSLCRAAISSRQSDFRVAAGARSAAKSQQTHLWPPSHVAGWCRAQDALGAKNATFSNKTRYTKRTLRLTTHKKTSFTGFPSLNAMPSTASLKSSGSVFLVPSTRKPLKSANDRTALGVMNLSCRSCLPSICTAASGQSRSRIQGASL